MFDYIVADMSFELDHDLSVVRFKEAEKYDLVRMCKSVLERMLNVGREITFCDQKM